MRRFVLFIPLAVLLLVWAVAGKVKMQTNFDLGNSQLQSTISGEKKGDAHPGTYETKALADGSVVDQGDWKVAPVQ